ncbi:MAG: desulfoferrodoxin [Thermoanaerobacteraceae bacterium]|nr:desulfoferrodoxin [Thermoanaerobacteraceae bacterium]
MTALKELYKCSICGNVVEIVHEGAPALVCCHQPMEKIAAKREDQGKEKHVPVIKESSNGIRVEVGDVHHPMEQKHYIKFIEVLTENKLFRAELVPDQLPVAEFPVSKADVVTVRSYCNLHGLWEA